MLSFSKNVADTTFKDGLSRQKNSTFFLYFSVILTSKKSNLSDNFHFHLILSSKKNLKVFNFSLIDEKFYLNLYMNSEYFPQRYLIGEYSQLLGINKGCVCHLINECLLEHNYISHTTRITLVYNKKCYDWKPVYTVSKLLSIKMIELFDKLLNIFSF